jgi:uncharacterized protein (TIGR02453 family)
MPFEGFPPEGLHFLAGLAEHNEKAWFDEHRVEYERGLLEPARDFVEAMGVELEAVYPGVNADPRVNGSIMRINRDTRFSKDKRPFKTHLDLWFWEGVGPSRTRPGFWFRLTPKQLILGAGRHHFEPPLLARYREAVVDERLGPALSEAVDQVQAAGYELGGRHYKRPPAGFDAPPERADLLLHDGLFAGVELPLPEETHTARFPAFCAGYYARLAPLVRWLARLDRG